MFDRLRHATWWRAPLVATLLAAVLDTAVFWSIAFAGTEDPWVTWALGDLAVKLALGVALLLPFRLFIGRQLAPPAACRASVPRSRGLGCGEAEHWCGRTAPLS